MAEIINLNKVRKDKARKERAAAATENRIRFGRSKAERVKATLDAAREQRRLDGHRRDEDEA